MTENTPQTSPIPATIDAELMRVYRGSEYRVFAGAEGPSYTLKIGEHCPAVVEELAHRGVDGACFVTAYNPASIVRSDLENRLAQNQLLDLITERGFGYRPGMGEDPGGECVGEPCFLVFGITRPEAHALGQKWGQNAVVWVSSKGFPELLLTR